MRSTVRGRILVVDDEPNARTALSELLRDEGYDVSSANDAELAQARMIEFHPDLVLSDVHMPGAGGLGLLAAARAATHGPEVVLMSARPQPEAADAPFVCKPIDIELLLTIIETVIARRRRQLDAPASTAGRAGMT
jgi:DNA-binding response OmpR family regulator